MLRASVDFGIYLISSLPGICNRLEVAVPVKTVLIRAEDVATDRCSRYGRSCAHYYSSSSLFPRGNLSIYLSPEFVIVHKL